MTMVLGVSTHGKKYQAKKEQEKNGIGIDPLHDDVKNQNKPGALRIVGFIGGSTER